MKPWVKGRQCETGRTMMVERGGCLAGARSHVIVAYDTCG
jgi:hypothetical protein